MVTLASLESNVFEVLELLAFGSNADVVAIYGSTVGPATAGGTPSTPAIGNLINSVFGQSNIAVSAGQLFAQARPLKATVRETSKVMEHPAETGILIADHHIINPVEIDIQFLIPAQFYGTTYAQMRQAFVNATNLTVQTKTGIYPNMIIADMPHEESPDTYDAITMLLHLKQVLLAPNAQTYSPLSPLNQNTLQAGLQSAVALTTQAATIASGIASYANIGKFI